MNYLRTRCFRPMFHNLDGMRHLYQSDVETNNGFDVDIVEKEDEFLLKANLPGFDAQEVKIGLNGNHLNIEASQEKPSEGADKAESEYSDGHFLFNERKHGKRSRSFILSNSVEPNSFEAFMDKGVLTIHVKKKVEHQSRLIEVKSK